MYQRDGGEPHRLKPLSRDLFAVGEIDYFRLRFERDDHSQVIRLVGLYLNGREESNEKEIR